MTEKREQRATPTVTIDAREAAAYLAVNIETIYRMARAGELPHTRVGRALRFRTDKEDQPREARRRGANE